MAEEVRITKLSSDNRYTVGQEGIVGNAYFQHDYFENDYFQAGQLAVSSNTVATTQAVTYPRTTVRLD